MQVRGGKRKNLENTDSIDQKDIWDDSALLNAFEHSISKYRVEISCLFTLQEMQKGGQATPIPIEIIKTKESTKEEVKLSQSNHKGSAPTPKKQKGFFFIR